MSAIAGSPKRRRPVNQLQAWKRVRLGDVADHVLGKMLDAAKNKGTLRPYLRNPNVKWFQIDLSETKLMPFEDDELERFSVRNGDVVICEGGEAGRAAIWEGRPGEIMFQKAIHRVRPGPDLFNRYLVHQLMADYFSGRLADYYTGATIKHLTGQDLDRYEFYLPPIAEQRRIVAILDAAGDLRQKRRQALRLLDRLSRTIFIEMFGSPATNPRKWPTTTIAALLESASYGTSAKAGAAGATPILRMNNLTYDGKMELGDLKYLDLHEDEVDRYTVRDGDILFNRTNSADLVGKTAVYRGNARMAYAGYLVRLRTNSEAVPDYVSAFLNSQYGKAVLRGMCKSIIGMANINATEVQTIRIPKPPVKLQRKFADRLSAIAAVRREFEQSEVKLGALFKSLQHRAFRGEL